MALLVSDDIELKRAAMDVLTFAQCAVSKVSVGAAVFAMDKFGNFSKIFAAPNIEITIGSKDNIHAEILAMHKAISEGYTKPIKCVITSNSNIHKAAMCGDCLQFFTYLDPSGACEIEVIHEETGEVLVSTTVKERQGPYGYFSHSCKINAQMHDS